jgi:hypothetical protein
MLGLLIPTLILAVVVYSAGRRSGRPGLLSTLYFFLAIAAALGCFTIPFATEFASYLTDAWAPAQPGDDFGFGRLGAFAITAVFLGSVAALPVVMPVGFWMARRRGPTWSEFERLVRQARAVCGQNISASDVGFDENDFDHYLRNAQDEQALDEVASISGENPVPPEFWDYLQKAAKLRGLEAHARRYENKLKRSAVAP